MNEDSKTHKMNIQKQGIQWIKMNSKIRASMIKSPLNSTFRCFSTSSKFNALSVSSFYDLKAKDIDGKIIDFSTFKKKVCLVVNINEDELIRMSKLGHMTHPTEYKQLMELRLLNEKYGKKDLSILAFPTCEKEVTHEHSPPQYNVNSIVKDPKQAEQDIKQAIHDTFKVMAPIHLNNSHQENEVFAFLKEKAEELEKKIARHPELLEGEDISVIQMFTKFLVNRRGQVVARFGKDVEPEQMQVWIEQLLAEKV
ncbi:hypothetical protein C9374_014413 [Naegleria lovaniensis]|uniref:Uncharacterized protein n=1 Tax=Naegleria lovaniensis TaxID=51637 RepID=A0AA88GZ20_NAELO|nr:uncharacterized protein C9374_014413 [Naegleria lovaniensis]KAG2389013.1 hypothetical protein C9374_014413 [Naegleria lovaniensis]